MYRPHFSNLTYASDARTDRSHCALTPHVLSITSLSIVHSSSLNLHPKPKTLPTPLAASRHIPSLLRLAASDTPEAANTGLKGEVDAVRSALVLDVEDETLLLPLLAAAGGVDVVGRAVVVAARDVDAQVVGAEAAQGGVGGLLGHGVLRGVVAGDAVVGLS